MSDPLQDNLRVQTQAQRELFALLREAEREAGARVLRLAGRTNTGALVERAQLNMIVNALRLWQQEVFMGPVQEILERYITRAVLAGARSESGTRRALFALIRAPGAYVALEHSLELTARATVSSYLARAANNIPLSQQVYRTSVSAGSMLQRTINLQILQGASWRDLAAAVRPFVNPSTPGGAAYAAKRLARTELNNAFLTSQRVARQAKPWSTGMRWHLSRSHPRHDICDSYANQVFDFDAVPRSHPQCLCFRTTETVSEKAFIDSFVNGRYDAFLSGGVQGRVA